MAYEISVWKAPNCSLPVNIDNLSGRERHSREINKREGEGGGLNADYRTVEAAMVAANLLGLKLGLEYGVHFVFKTARFGIINLDFDNEDHRRVAAGVL